VDITEQVFDTEADTPTVRQRGGVTSALHFEVDPREVPHRDPDPVHWQVDPAQRGQRVS
jgi:hypothetical protein